MDQGVAAISQICFSFSTYRHPEGANRDVVDVRANQNRVFVEGKTA